jgi:multicomponent Na+:H+ antiporter subunit D
VTIPLVLPIVIPFIGAIIAMVLWRRPRLQRIFSTVASTAHLGAALVLLRAVTQKGILVAQVGNWPAPFGITLVADLLGAIMVVLAALMGAAVAVYSLAAIDRDREAFGYYPLVQMLLAGVSGAFLTGDIFNLYVWFEVLLMASFVLMSLGGERRQIEGGLKYVALNLIASALLLAAVGLLYGAVGTLNMADLAERVAQNESRGLIHAVAILFLVAFGIKAAVFPLFFWLPASYHVPPIPVAAIFAGLLTKVGVYALIRVFTLLFTEAPWYTHGLLLVISALTMVTGVLGALAQNDIRRILSFHIVSQIGYMVMGLALFTPLAIAGSVFYVVHHIVVKTNLFLIAGLVGRLAGSFELARLGALYRSRPAVAVLFLVPALSLAGMPPLSGFFAKLALIRAGLDAGQYVMVGIALVVGLFTLMSMTKIWNEVFWKEWSAPRPIPVRFSARERASLLLPAGTLALVTILLGIVVEPVFGLAVSTAEQLLDRHLYIAAVMESRR